METLFHVKKRTSHYLTNLRSRYFLIRFQIICFCIVISTISAYSQFVRTNSGIVVSSKEYKIELAAVNNFAFNISVSKNAPKAIASIFLDQNKSVTKFSIINEDNIYGIKTSYGKLTFNFGSNTLSVYDVQGKELITEGKITTTDSSQTITYASNPSSRMYGSGNYSTKDLIKHRSAAQLGNGLADIPYLWSTQGYSALAVTTNDNDPAKWNEHSDNITWTFHGGQADLYIWPAKNLYDAAKGFVQLTGKPKLPPMWAFGYLQSQWGWRDRAYIEDVLSKFKTHNLPVDAFIYDFEWYTTKPDYEIGKAGEPDFSDFAFNPKLFPEPSKQIADYKKQGVKFIGIRKPRLGNSSRLDLMRHNKWLIHPATDSRDLDFSNAALRSWYEAQTQPLLDTGVDAWWDDEGESYYSCYYWWNVAQSHLLSTAKPNERHFSINRSFTPGNQRLGYCTWNGDIQSSWKDLRGTPADLLNYSIAGMNYGSCDIGGFHGTPKKETLVRWFQTGVFLPIMRAHSDIMTTPRFPWLWDNDGEDAIHKALNLRYRFIPFLYSLGHEAYNTGAPTMRPLVMEFPNDPKVFNLTDEWLLGKGLLAAPILDSGGKRTIYLPNDTWYDFNTGDKISGPSTIAVTKALDEIPIYVRAGTILPLGPVVQNTEQKTNEPLELRIYPGHNGSFALYEDDGHTYNYTKGLVRKTVFNWNDVTKTLSWNVSGNYSGANIYKSIKIVVGDAIKTVSIGKGGKLQFK